MFCGNCGRENPEGAAFCGSCGAPMTAGETPGGQAPVKNAKANRRHKLIGLGAVLVGAVVVLALLAWLFFALFGGRGPEDVAVRYVKAALVDQDAGAVVGLMPKEYVQKVVEDMYTSRSELIDDVEDELEDNADGIEDEYGEYTLKIRTRGVEKWTEDRVERYNGYLESYGFKTRVQSGADVELHLTLNGTVDNDSQDLTLSAVQIGGKWYLDFLEDSFF